MKKVVSGVPNLIFFPCDNQMTEDFLPIFTLKKSHCVFILERYDSWLAKSTFSKMQHAVKLRHWINTSSEVKMRFDSLNPSSATY